jgi:hypothetical protein
MESSFLLLISLQVQHDLHLHFFQSFYAILFGICYNSSPFFCFWIIKDKFTWHIIHLMIWGLFPWTMLLSFTMRNDQHNAFLSCPFHFSLCKCNFYKFVCILSSSLWMALDYVCRLQFSSIVSIKNTSSIETWLGKISQYSFSINISLILEDSVLQKIDMIIMEKMKQEILWIIKWFKL